MHCNPFHLAIQVRDIKEARKFYRTVLGCEEGRSADSWVDFNLYGHQLVCHLNAEIGKNGKITAHANLVDGHDVPVPHFGVVLDMMNWKMLAQRLREQKIEFIIEPHVRFAGQTGEQATMFFLDPSGNAIEFKAFQDVESQLFAT